MPLCLSAEDLADVINADVKPTGIISIGKYNKPKHTKYEIGSIGGMRFTHDKVYEEGTLSSLGYKRRSSDNITGLWSKINAEKILFNVQMIYTHNTYKYDRNISNDIKAHARYHGYSLTGIIDAYYQAFDLNFIKLSPILGLSYDVVHKRAFSEKYAGHNDRNYEKNDLKTLKLRFGALLERDFYICSRKCRVYSKLIYTRVLDDSNPKIKFTENNVRKYERSNFQKKDGFELTTGTTVNIFSRWDVEISYQLFTDGKFSSHAALSKFSYNF